MQTRSMTKRKKNEEDQDSTTLSREFPNVPSGAKAKSDAAQVTLTKESREAKATRRNMMYLASAFLLAGCLVAFLFYNFPPLRDEDKARLKFPRNAEDLRVVNSVLSNYTEDYYWFVVTGFCSIYVFLQAFAIPGPLLLSILSGALFGGVKGFLLVCLCATFGASACYWLFYLLGHGVVHKFFPQMIVWYNEKLNKRRDNLFYYLLFLRFTPLVPNWFVNISSPILDVPFPYFFFATLFGLMPANIIHIRAGLTLNDLQKVGGLDPTSFLSLLALSLVALLPTLFKKKLQKLDE